MANVLHVSGIAQNQSAGTAYATFGDIAGTFTTEPARKLPVRNAGTFSNLYLRMATSSTSTACTVTFRKNTANGSQSISIGAAATGDFQDAVNTDAVIAGDLVDFVFVTSDGVVLTGSVNILFAATTNSTKRLTVNHGLGVTAASTTNYLPLAGSNANTGVTTEANLQFKAKTAGTLTNFAAYISANARTTATTFGSRKNTAAGTLTVSVGSTATGLFEDTTHSDTVAVNDLLNYSLLTGTGTASITPQFLSCEYTTTNSQGYVIASVGGGKVLSLSTTTYFMLGGSASSSSTTEANVTSSALSTFNATNLQIRLTTNTVTAASTVNLRKNSGNATNTASITASTTGIFEDTTHTDAIVATDDLNYQVVTGGTGTSLTVTLLGVLLTATTPAPPANTTNFFLMFS